MKVRRRWSRWRKWTRRGLTSAAVLAVVASAPSSSWAEGQGQQGDSPWLVFFALGATLIIGIALCYGRRK
jgi:hypothetical protein